MREPKNYKTDAGVRLTFDTLTDRGHDPETVRIAINSFDGDLWWDVYGPAVDKAAERIGLPSQPGGEMGVITALHIRADGGQEVFMYDPTAHDSLEKLQERVGGWLEAAPVEDRRITMYCDEEGKIKGKPVNMKATLLLVEGSLDVIVGDVVLVGAPDYHGYDTSLPREFLPVRRNG